MTPFNKIRLFNCYGHGDLYSTREFIKELVDAFPEKDIEYSHGKNERIFADIMGLIYSKIDSSCDNAKGKYSVGNTLYINTWVGRNGKYVTPGNTVSITNIKNLFNEEMKNIHSFDKGINEYIPQVDFSKFNIKPINKFLEKRRNVTLIFISNCIAQSSQAENFDFDPIIERLCDEFPHFDFITTNGTLVVKDNLHYSIDITQSEDGFDLNELSYLSTYCNPIIGRGSGAYCFAMNKENVLNMSPQKYFIGFTHTPYGSNLLYGQDLCCIVLSNAETDTDKVGDYIVMVLRG